MRDDGLADVFAVKSKNMAKAARAVTRLMRNAEGNLLANQLGAKELTALEVPWLEGRKRLRQFGPQWM